ncbi:hypothetical protein MTO96_006559 [Rhipicephalus appendiculatus]
MQGLHWSDTDGGCCRKVACLQTKKWALVIHHKETAAARRVSSSVLAANVTPAPPRRGGKERKRPRLAAIPSGTSPHGAASARVI